MAQNIQLEQETVKRKAGEVIVQILVAYFQRPKRSTHNSVLNHTQIAMAALLPSAYFGAGATAMQIDNGDTRIYYQGADGAIYRTGGMGTAASGAKYSQGVVLVPAESVRFNTPMAVVAWGNNFSEVNNF
ncbi:hypothetical protein B0H14DRAFT_3505231 [Mycena olivaceomarginata]|nr:hypothetical protein B0H14DRAFT_3505231 [Mycena olivaceomarginata]